MIHQSSNITLFEKFAMEAQPYKNVDLEAAKVPVVVQKEKEDEKGTCRRYIELLIAICFLFMFVSILFRPAPTRWCIVPVKKMKTICEYALQSAKCSEELWYKECLEFVEKYEAEDNKYLFHI